MANICVYGSSSDAIDQVYLEDAYKMGQELAKAGYGLVFGAGNMGVMGASARGAHSVGGKVIGVLPHFMNLPGIPYSTCDELLLTDTMRERKQLMETLSEVFVAAPGGIGTFEEFFEMITLKQLGQHEKAIVLLNTNNYYTGLSQMIEHCVHAHFAKPPTLDLYYMASSVEAAMAYIENYEYTQPGEKWFR